MLEIFISDQYIQENYIQLIKTFLKLDINYNEDEINIAFMTIIASLEDQILRFDKGQVNFVVS